MFPNPTADPEAAKENFELALQLYSQAPYPLGEARTRANYGAFLLGLNLGQEAMIQLRHAETLLETYGDARTAEELGMVRNNLGKAHQDKLDFSTAIKYYQEAVDIFESIGACLMRAQARENIGLIKFFQGKNGLRELKEALAVYREKENRDHEANTLFNIYSVTFDETESRQQANELLELLAEHNIEHNIESGILFGIQPYEIRGKRKLLIFRERMQQLRVFYTDQKVPTGIGRSLLQLAKIETVMGSLTKKRSLARQADK